jgi:2-succinyl-5-enolpyruvyl-6-hydroxy-3-cyclohexene-1-carboxylate synthase
MIPVNSTYAPLQALVDELARCGMTHAVTSPGSRNAPLVLTLAGDPRLQAVSVLDERSAGFVALGIAKASGRPVGVTCTSGSACANLLPAVVEAHEARVPLIVLTADRPPELRDTGAGQAINQIKMYGSFAKWFVEVGSHEPGRDTAVHHRALACRAWHTAAGGRPGVVHLNFPLREPLAPVREELDPADWEGRADGGPWVQVHRPPTEQPVAGPIAARMAGTSRGVIVCGAAGPGIAEPLAALAAATGWPVLADPLSGVRCGAHDRSHVVSHYDVLLRGSAWAAAHQPELVLRIGDTPTSKPLRAWLAGSAQLVVDPHAAWHEPTRAAETIVQAAPGPLCEALARELAGAHEPDGAWLGEWRAADHLVPAALAETPADFEPRAWLAAVQAAAPGSIVWVASSMPIRDVETFLPSTAKPLRFLSNRGANGIDGTVSSAAGAALASGRPVTLLTGELALLHDVGGLLAVRRAGAELNIVCANNGGGGIFDFLPLAGAADRELYEEHIVTPAGVDLERVAAMAGVPYRLATDAVDIGAQPGLTEVRTDRAQNVAGHCELFAHVAQQISLR